MAPLEFAPQVIPAPVTLADGTTLYPGETTGLVTDPTVMAANFPAGTTEPGLEEASQCSTADTMSQEFHHPVKGYSLTKYYDDVKIGFRIQ